MKLKELEYQRFILSTRPTLWLPLYREGGDTILSSDGYGHLATVTGALWRQQGRTFDGIDDRIVVPDATAIQNIFDSGGSVLVWANPTSDGEADSGRLLDKTNGGTSFGWILYVLSEAAGFVQLGFIACFNTIGFWRTTNAVVPIRQSNCIGVTYNSSDVANDPTFYINGTTYTVGNGITEAITPIGARLSDVGQALWIGNRVGTDITWDGVISEALLYKDKILSASEVENYRLKIKWRRQ